MSGHFSFLNITPSGSTRHQHVEVPLVQPVVRVAPAVTLEGDVSPVLVQLLLGRRRPGKEPLHAALVEQVAEVRGWAVPPDLDVLQLGSVTRPHMGAVHY